MTKVLTYVYLLILLLNCLVVSSQSLSKCNQNVVISLPINPIKNISCNNNVLFIDGSVYLNTTHLKTSLVVSDQLVIINQPWDYYLDNVFIKAKKINIEGQIKVKNSKNKYLFNCQELTLTEYAKIDLKLSSVKFNQKIKFANVTQTVSDQYNHLKIISRRWFDIKTRNKNKDNNNVIVYQAKNIMFKLFFQDIPLVLAVVFTLIIVPIFIYFVYKSMKDIYRRRYYHQIETVE